MGIRISASFSEKKIKTFLGYFDPENNFFDNKINKFRGDLPDHSARMEAVVRIADNFGRLLGNYLLQPPFQLKKKHCWGPVLPFSKLN